MNATNIPLIQKIAEHVRKQCLTFAMSKSSHNHDYHNHKDLSCMCAVASYTLLLALKKHNIPSKLIYGKVRRLEDLDTEFGDDHCWIKIKNLIVDITATQFKHLNATLISIKPSKSLPQYSQKKIIKSYKEIEWENQSPSPSITKHILSIKH